MPTVFGGENGDDFLVYSFEGDFDIFNYGTTNFVGASQIQDPNDRQFLIDEWFDIFNLEADPAATPQSDIEVNGGLGTDTAILDLSYRTTAITFTLGTSNTTISGENITLDSIEQVWFRGSTLDDSITGGALNDRLYGNDGADTLNGGGGDDFVFGGNGYDTLLGGDGNDLLVSTNRFQQFDRPNGFAVQAKPNAPVNDYFFGLQTIYEQTGNDEDRLIDGGAGRDIITGGKGRDILTGGDGTDFFVFETLSDRGDTIEDFSSAQKDKLRISRDGLGLEDTFKLVLGNTLLIDKTPGDDDPAFLFNSKTGVLSFDRNGSDPGGSSAILTLVDVDVIKPSDFQFFA